MSFLFYVILQFVFYSLFIYMIHHVFYYVKDNVMTPPKKPVAPLKSKKYQEMMESLDRVVVSASEQQQLALIEPNFDMESSLLGVLVEEGAL